MPYLIQVMRDGIIRSQLDLRRDYKNNWRINEQIRAGELRVIGSDGKQIGVITRDQALASAREAELDLVEIAPNARPPVAKIVDFTKFKYEQEKRERQERKREKRGKVLKEIWFTPFIGEGDFRVRIERVKEFLGEREKVRITIRPKRRLPDAKPLYRMLERVVKELEGLVRVEQEPKLLGRQLVTQVAPGGQRPRLRLSSAEGPQAKEGEKHEGEDENKKNSHEAV